VLDEEDYPSTPGKVERSGGEGGDSLLDFSLKGRSLFLRTR
jgi:hypothetical protein